MSSRCEAMIAKRDGSERIRVKFCTSHRKLAVVKRRVEIAGRQQA